MDLQKIEIVKNLYTTHSDSELAKMLKVNKATIARCRKENKLVKTKKINPKSLTYAEKLFVKNNYEKLSYQQMAKKLNRSESVLQRFVNELYKQGFAKKQNSSHANFLNSNIRFVSKTPSQVSLNNLQKKQAKRKVGEVYWRAKANEYYIKTAKKIIPFRIWLWQKVNGTILKGTVIRFLDGNSKNVSIENLALFTQKEMLQINSSSFDALQKRKKSFKGTFAKKRFMLLHGKQIFS